MSQSLLLEIGLYLYQRDIGNSIDDYNIGIRVQVHSKFHMHMIFHMS